jgi:tRNA(Met) C34 N-acetyltransferase TmcA
MYIHMYLGGPGGTGKSRVIGAIVTLFERAGCSEKLRVSATTGVAAQLVRGSTIDSLCKLWRQQNGVREKKPKEMDEDEGGMMNDTDSNWAQCEFLIVDEVSMLGGQKLAKISKALMRLKGVNLPFGGLSYVR